MRNVNRNSASASSRRSAVTYPAARTRFIEAVDATTTYPRLLGGREVGRFQHQRRVAEPPRIPHVFIGRSDDFRSIWNLLFPLVNRHFLASLHHPALVAASDLELPFLIMVHIAADRCIHLNDHGRLCGRATQWKEAAVWPWSSPSPRDTTSATSGRLKPSPVPSAPPAGTTSTPPRTANHPAGGGDPERKPLASPPARPSLTWACTHSASVGIGPCRVSLWSTMVVNNHGSGLFARSQVAARTASATACLPWERSSVSVHASRRTPLRWSGRNAGGTDQRCDIASDAS